jgi:uncharacterized membrane protein YphA (DoxX/SURF4 family)
MNTMLWTGQVILALVFAASGIMKISWDKARLVASGQTGVQPFPAPLIKAVAACELVAVIGLIVPRATGIAPVLTPLAATGLALVMLGAIASHIHLREARNVAVTTTLRAICVLVAWGRF